MQGTMSRWIYFFFSSRRRHTRYWRDWSSDVCSSDLTAAPRFHRYGVLPKKFYLYSENCIYYEKALRNHVENTVWSLLLYDDACAKPRCFRCRASEHRLGVLPVGHGAVAVRRSAGYRSSGFAAPRFDPEPVLRYQRREDSVGDR